MPQLQNPRPRIVTPEEWDLSQLNDRPRQERLLDAPSPERLIDRLVDEATATAVQNEIRLGWKEAREKPGYFRANAIIPITKETFDVLFNGRTGYRAQFYLSAEEGILFNRQIVDDLIPCIRTAYQHRPLDTNFALVERSLRTPHSKIWVVEKPVNPFIVAPPDTLNPQRWAKNEKAVLGRRRPLADRFEIDLKGSFIDPITDDFFVDQLKAARACDLYCKGYS